MVMEQFASFSDKVTKRWGSVRVEEDRLNESVWTVNRGRRSRRMCVL